MSSYLIKAMRKFYVLTILSIRNMSQHKGPFTHLFVTNLPFIFMWVQFVKNQLKMWKKLLPLIIDHSGYNDNSISFLIFSYLQWNMITTRFTSIPPLVIIHMFHYQILSPWRFWKVSPGLGENYASKYGSGIFPHTVTYILCVEKCQNHILMHSFLPIPGRPFKNVMDSGSQTETYTKLCSTIKVISEFGFP